MFQLAGWGSTRDFDGSDFLMTADLPIITYNNCKNNMNVKITLDKFCAGFENGNYR